MLRRRPLSRLKCAVPVCCESAVCTSLKPGQRYAAIEYKAQKKPGLDWWGVNYYSRGIIGLFGNGVTAPGELMTDFGYSLYPEGLYENLVRGSALGVPMYVTEIGAADCSEDDHVRIAHIESFMRQVRYITRDAAKGRTPCRCYHSLCQPNTV
jgi:beta-glucosidase/6-phospho-beta-glucosidase/beta-galactosidase